tara:strand:- start:3673 stop:3996 length:324 start_codon:yes stop_codon:yes gene_type:complete
LGQLLRYATLGFIDNCAGSLAASAPFPIVDELCQVVSPLRLSHTMNANFSLSDPQILYLMLFRSDFTVSRRTTSYLVISSFISSMPNTGVTSLSMDHFLAHLESMVV